MAGLGPSPTGHQPGDTMRGKGEVLSVEEVDRRLVALGVDPEKLEKTQKYGDWGVSKCVRAAIQRGYIELRGESKEELNQVIWKGKFPDWSCQHSKDVKLCEVLYQPDYGGNDYENGLEDATVLCNVPDCKNDLDDERGRMYLAEICSGRPHPDSGKFHNHCRECPGFGVCIGDYREAHCDQCNGHYFAGCISSYRCPCQGGGRVEDSDSDSYYDYHDSDSDSWSDCLQK